MAISSGAPLFLITSEWINQQINDISQGFDISSSVSVDHISEERISMLHWCNAPNWLWLSWLVADFKDRNWHSDFKNALNFTSQWTGPAQLCECCWFCHVRAVDLFSCSAQPGCGFLSAVRKRSTQKCEYISEKESAFYQNLVRSPHITCQANKNLGLVASMSDHLYFDFRPCAIT